MDDRQVVAAGALEQPSRGGQHRAAPRLLALADADLDFALGMTVLVLVVQRQDETVGRSRS